MRKTFTALLPVVCVAVPLTGQVRGQQPPPQSAKPAAPAAATLDPDRNALDRHLVRWEEAMKKMRTLALACSRTEVEKVLQTKKVYEGTIHFARPTYFFWDMKVKGKPQEFERLIGTGQFIYQYLPGQKELRVYTAPKPRPGGGLADDSSIAFLFGMPAAEAKRRYELSLFREDRFYVYVDIVAKRDVDKVDFRKARIVLHRDTYLPRQLWFEHPNGSEVTWDIPTIESNKAIPQTVFAAPPTPKGWKMVQGQSPAQRQGTGQPRLYRPQQR
jgi:TIGR03009 family protein